MHTPTKRQLSYGTPANSEHETDAPVEDPLLVRNMRPEWDPKKDAASHLLDDALNEDRLRPLLKGASAALVTRMNLERSREQGPDPTALLDSIISKTELLGNDLQNSGTLDGLPSDKAEFIPLIFENLKKFCDHAKQSKGSRQHAEPQDLRQKDEASTKVAEQQERINSMSAKLLDADTREKKYRDERNSLREQIQEERKQRELNSKELESLREKQEKENRELRRSNDEYLSLLNEERLNTIRLTKQCDELRSRLNGVGRRTHGE